jgi:hypothetical protein
LLLLPLAPLPLPLLLLLLLLLLLSMTISVLPSAIERFLGGGNRGATLAVELRRAGDSVPRLLELPPQPA